MARPAREPEALAQQASKAVGESEELDFKGEWPGDLDTREKTVRHLVAMANSGGGLIAFGCSSNGTPTGADLSAVLKVDPKQIVDALRSATGEIVEGVKVVQYTRPGGATLPGWFVPRSPKVLVFSRDSRHGSSSTGSPWFVAGQVVFRHGSSTETANSTDIDRLIQDVADERFAALLKQAGLHVGATENTSAIELPPSPPGPILEPTVGVTSREIPPGPPGQTTQI